MLEIISRYVVLFLCCFITSLVIAELENKVKELTKEDTIEWQLVNINYFPDSLSDSESDYKTSKLFNKLLVRSNQHQLIFNEKYFINIKPTNDSLDPDIRILLELIKQITDADKKNNLIIFTNNDTNYIINTKQGKEGIKIISQDMIVNDYKCDPNTIEPMILNSFN